MSVDSTINRAHQHAGVHHAVDGRGRPLAVIVAPGQGHDGKMLPDLLDEIREPRDQRANRQRRGARGGRPVTYDQVTNKGRNVVERSFARLKQWRGLATRYDKLAIVYRAAVRAAAITWLRHIGDTLGATTRWSSAPRSS